MAIQVVWAVYSGSDGVSYVDDGIRLVAHMCSMAYVMIDREKEVS